MSSTSIRVQSATIGVLMLAAAAVAQDTSNWIPMYEILELAGADATRSTRAYSVNDTGQVVGSSEGSESLHPAHWLTTIYTDLHGTVHFDLLHPYVLYNQNYGEAFDISNADQVVGTARDLIKCPDTNIVLTNAFLLRAAVLSDLATPYPGDALTNLMTFYNPCIGGYDSAAIGISNTSYVVGWADQTGGVIRAFLITPVNNAFVSIGLDGGNDLLIDLGTLGGSDPVSSASAVNDEGQVTGYSYTSIGGLTAYRAFRVDPIDTDLDGKPDTWFVAGPTGENTLMHAIPTIGGNGNNGWGRAINNAGDVAGESDMIAPNGAFFTHAFLNQGGNTTDLGTLASDQIRGNSAASGVNDNGVVVGWAENDDHERRAFVFKDGKMQDLNSLLYLYDKTGKPIVPSMVLTEARDVNENGVIVGWGTVRGSGGSITRGFLLNPILVNPDTLQNNNGNSNASANTNSSGGSTGPGFSGDPIFGPPAHLQGVTDANSAGTGSTTGTSSGLLSLCGLGVAPASLLTLIGLAGLRAGMRRS